MQDWKVTDRTAGVEMQDRKMADDDISHARKVDLTC